MKTISENKYWDSANTDVISNVARAAVVMEMVQIKFNKDVKINTDASRPHPTRESSSRGKRNKKYVS